MKFNLFMYGTVGRRAELEAGMAGKDPQRYRCMLTEIADLARLADGAGYFGFGHPEHHLQIEGFEAANDPCLMAMWLGRHGVARRPGLLGRHHGVRRDRCPGAGVVR